MNVIRFLLALMMFFALACLGDSQQGTAFENPSAGKALIKQAGCGSCHYIPGIKTARGQVGPPLVNMTRRAYLAGILPNNFRNMVLWIQHPQQVAPGSAMPDLGLDTAEAEAIAAYLYSLK